MASQSTSGTESLIHIYIYAPPASLEDTGRRVVRWCFGCRKRLEHLVVLIVDLSGWHEAVLEERCPSCQQDHTRFPGF